MGLSIFKQGFPNIIGKTKYHLIISFLVCLSIIFFLIKSIKYKHILNFLDIIWIFFWVWIKFCFVDIYSLGFRLKQTGIWFLIVLGSCRTLRLLFICIWSQCDWTLHKAYLLLFTHASCPILWFVFFLSPWLKKL